MASDSFLSWSNRTVLRAGREDLYLSIQDIVVFVRDLDVSLRFYVDQLGFELILDKRVTSDGLGWVEVAPPDGNADLAVTTENSGIVVILLGDGKGSFTEWK